MPNLRNTEIGAHSEGSQQFRVLAHLSLNQAAPTKEITNLLNCTNPTALKRLRELEQLNLLTISTSGRGYRWSLNTSRLDQNAVGAQEPHPKVPQLITEVIEQTADHLTGPEETIHDYPNIQTWLRRRGVDDTYPQLTYAYRIAIYCRFLQSTLYRLHQSEHTELSQLSETADWSTSFEHAYKITDDNGFQDSPIDELLDDDVAVHRLLLSLSHSLLYDPQPANTLAQIYEELTSQDARRDLGQFATPVHVGRFMASWSIQNSDDAVLDPGIGAGQLASQALFEKIGLGAEDPLRDITGIDIDEVAITMASTALKLVDGEGSPRLRKTDFVSYGSVYTNGGRETFDAVISNPPYSRHQALDERFKGEIHSTISYETGFDFSRRTPLYAFFIAHAAQFVNDGSRLAFIIPSKFMETKFGRKVKEYLLNEFRIHAVIQLSDEMSVFEDVRIRPSILLLEAGSPPESHETHFIKLNEWPEIDTASDLLNREVTQTELGGVENRTTIAQKLISPSERWTHYFDTIEVDELPQLARFEDIASIKRGIATGNNDYFCLSSKDLEEYPIPEQYLKRILRTARGMDAVDVNLNDWQSWEKSGDDVWLLYCYDDDGVIERENIENEPLMDYLDKGLYEGVTDGYLVSNRDPWYRVEERNPVLILGKYMNRKGFHFMRNDANLLTLNNVHGIDPEFESDELVNPLLAYLNSNLFERQLAKRSHDYNGLQKIEVGQLESAPVVDPRELSANRRDRLNSLFEKLSSARRSGSSDEGILSSIEIELEEFLNIHEKEE